MRLSSSLLAVLAPRALVPFGVLFLAACTSLTSPPSPEPISTDTTTTTAAPAGLQMQDLKVGTGPAAKAGDRLSVHYVGTLTDGSEFDSSRKRGTPFDVTIGRGQVIKGWDQGIVGMQVGGRRKLTIPPDLAYGANARPGIPANSTLVFDVELLAINPPPQAPAAQPPPAPTGDGGPSGTKQAMDVLQHLREVEGVMHKGAGGK